MMRLAANMHHMLSMRDLAHATILDTMEAMQASECVVVRQFALLSALHMPPPRRQNQCREMAPCTCPGGGEGEGGGGLGGGGRVGREGGGASRCKGSLRNVDDDSMQVLRWIPSTSGASSTQAGAADDDIFNSGVEAGTSMMKLRKFSILDGRLEDDVVQVAHALLWVPFAVPSHFLLSTFVRRALLCMRV